MAAIAGRWTKTSGDSATVLTRGGTGLRLTGIKFNCIGSPITNQFHILAVDEAGTMVPVNRADVTIIDD